MVKIVGNDIWRGAEKIGYVEGTHIRSHDGNRIGYFEGNYVYTEDGNKTAYIEEDHLVSYGGGSKIPLDTVNEAVEGGVLPEIGKCAVYVLLGS
jgi:hypothetical protein